MYFVLFIPHAQQPISTKTACNYVLVPMTIVPSGWEQRDTTSNGTHEPVTNNERNGLTSVITNCGPSSPPVLQQCKEIQSISVFLYSSTDLLHCSRKAHSNGTFEWSSQSTLALLWKSWRSALTSHSLNFFAWRKTFKLQLQVLKCEVKTCQISLAPFAIPV